MIQVAILTVSDSAMAGTRVDASGPKLRERAEALGWSVRAQEVVPDEVPKISGALIRLAHSDDVNVILTTGGTGVAARDVTPEATRDVIEREIPGLGEVMRADGRKFTPRAVLSRGIAGIRNRVLIVNFPGSPKGAVQSLDAVAELIPHIVDLLAGKTAH
jgi:molybdopterin adenylyltransferase